MPMLSIPPIVVPFYPKGTWFNQTWIYDVDEDASSQVWTSLGK